MDHTGHVWVSGRMDVIMAEVTSPKAHITKREEELPFFKLLPAIRCLGPRDSLNLLQNGAVFDVCKDSAGCLVGVMNKRIFLSDVVQRPYQYLALAGVSKKLDQFSFKKANGENFALDGLTRLLEFCPVKDPSWSELLHFASFLNVQLESTERSVFCDSNLMGDDLPGFKSFVVDFLVQMARDFSTRSVHIRKEFPDSFNFTIHNYLE